ncbi:MAG: SRPBCC domain-containing protein [candidate division Zixibacteria bacterium]|nr:SRPBCC domain-containing protein [candidate division Zixibacteria bacterium]
MTQFPHQAKQATFIAAPIEDVYDTITAAGGWDAFFTSGMELDAVPGGKMVWRWKNWGPDSYSVEVPARVVEADRPRRFAFEWGSKLVSTVTFDLTSEFGGTVIRSTESGYPDTTEGRDHLLECAAGWGEALTLLKFYLEHGITYTAPNRKA